MSRRTLHRHFLLRPEPKLNKLFLFLVGLFTEKFGVKLSAIQVMSDNSAS